MYIIDSVKRRDFIRKISEQYVYPRSFASKFIRNREDIEYAVVNLYFYGTPFNKRGSAKQPYLRNKGALASALRPFVDAVWNYFNHPQPNTPNTEPNFDRFHSMLCDLFLSCMRTVGYEHTYGNAQKMVGMLFKYLSCYSDYSSFSGLFDHCHLPIDRIMIIQLADRYQVPGTKKAGIYRGVCWSQMSKDDYLALLADYRAVLGRVKGDNSWLGAEYYIWTGEDLPTGGTHSISIKEFYM